MDRKRIRAFACRHQTVWLAKEFARTRWSVAPGAGLPPHTRDQDCLRPRAAVGNADNQNQYPNIVSTASRVSNNGRAGLNGTGALIVQSCGADAK
jgi:hypothetical protein